MGSNTADMQDGIAKLAIEQKPDNECVKAASTPEQDDADTAAAAVASCDHPAPAAEDADSQQQPLQSSVLDPALKQALIDANRPTVLKLEEAVLQFVADTSTNSLEFEPSTSNYERLLQHKVAQHHLLQTSTQTQTGAPRVVAKRPEEGKSRPQVPKLCDVDVATIKIEPKALIRRPPSANSMKGADGNSSTQQQQQRKQTHKEREADYHEARERLLGNSLAHSGGSTGNLMTQAAAGSNAGSRPGSAGAGRAPATAGAGFLAAMPRAGERGFNIVNAGRGAGRGGANPGRGSGARTGDAASSSAADAAAASADLASHEVDEQMQAATAKQQKQQHKQQKQQQPPSKQAQRPRQQQQHGVPRGPKAVYKDKQRDVQDPDYARGVDRFQARFDPGFQGAHGNMYNMPSYGSEFPTLGMAAGGPHSRTAHPPSAASSSSSRQHPSQAHGGSSSATPNGTARGNAAPRHHQSGAGSSIPGQQPHLQQYPPHFQQQQQVAPWGYYPAPVGDPVAANAMYGQMAAPGSWGYGSMGGAMDPGMASAYPYGACPGWGWGVPPGTMAPYAAAGYAPVYGMMTGHQHGPTPMPLPQQQQHGHPGAQGARRRGANSSKGVSKGPAAGSDATLAANGSKA